MLIVADNRRDALSPRLYPRPVRHEPTEQQQRDSFARARRRALHLQLHDLYRYAEAATEDTFSGKMNLPPERSESETGCSLTVPFVGWLDTHELSDPTETRRRRQLFTALARLVHERPDLSLIVVEHSRTHTSLTELARRWHVGTRTTTEGFAEGLDLMLGWLQD
jgi:hypothetical protein